MYDVHEFRGFEYDDGARSMLVIGGAESMWYLRTHLYELVGIGTAVISVSSQEELNVVRFSSSRVRKAVVMTEHNTPFSDFQEITSSAPRSFYRSIISSGYSCNTAVVTFVRALHSNCKELLGCYDYIILCRNCTRSDLDSVAEIVQDEGLDSTLLEEIYIGAMENNYVLIFDMRDLPVDVMFWNLIRD